MAKFDDKKFSPECSFCGRGQEEVKKVLLRNASKEGRLDYSLRLRDGLDVLMCVALNVLAVFPIVAPFALVAKPEEAILASNALGIAMLFLVGFAWAKASFRNRLLAGGVMALIGFALLTVIVVLGG